VGGQANWQRLGSNSADLYERHFVPSMFGAWAPILVELAKVQPGQHILDVACGTGVVAREAAARVGNSGRVVGLDLNAAMLGVARAAALAVAVWAEIEQSPGFAALVAALARHVNEAAANNRRAPFALSDALELERLVREAGFEDIRRQTRTGTARFPAPEKFVEWQVAASPLATLGGLSDEAFAAVCQDVSLALRPYVGANGCAFPMAAHLLTASHDSCPVSPDLTG
jgi:SAM-dependent methyltransferase